MQEVLFLLKSRKLPKTLKFTENSRSIRIRIPVFFIYETAETTLFLFCESRGLGWKRI